MSAIWARVSTSRRLRYAIMAGMLAGSLLFGYLAFSGSARAFLDLSSPPRLDYLGLALALVGFNHVLQSLVWHLYARDVHQERDALKDVLRYSVTALTRNLPGAFYWSVAGRVLLYQQDGRPGFATVRERKFKTGPALGARASPPAFQKAARDSVARRVGGARGDRFPAHLTKS